jgi:hypothetical protein
MMTLIFLPILVFCISCSGDQELGHGYTREGEFIYFEGKRIDREGAHDLDEFAVIVGHELTLANEVDAATFQGLSEDYSKDENKVYYKWISGPRFWVVEIPGADPATFEPLGLALARDKNHVWRADTVVGGADARTARSIEAGRVWLDANHVWVNRKIVEGADPATFEAMGDGYHYRDAKRVYWIFNQVRVVEGADPKTFTVPGK